MGNKEKIGFASIDEYDSQRCPYYETKSPNASEA